MRGSCPTWLSMSDNWITFIPTRPDHVPSPQAQQVARDLLAQVLPDAEVTARVCEQIELVHPYENWSGVRCPLCKADLEDWYVEAVQAASESAFADLTVITPCCGGTTNLNELDYVWPAGFSRFRIEAMNPNVKDVDAEVVKRLESILGCPLRRIWQHL